jgi:peptidoglycan/LPS O-acetylase OafA/YrhL
MTSSTGTKAKIASINGLRGIAICAVVLHHSFSYFAVASGVGKPLLTNGWLGVDLFFLLSGFVLYLPYANGRLIDAKDFYRRRFLRLAPLFFFVCLISTVFSPNPFALSAVALFGGLFALHPATFFPSQNWVLWSLGIEIYFSIAFPLVAYAFRRHVALTVALGIILSLIVQVIGFQLGYRQHLDWISASLPGRLDEFLLGTLAAHIWARQKNLPYSQFSIPLGCVMLALAMFGFDAWTTGFAWRFVGSILLLLADLGFFLLLMGALRRGWSARVLTSWPLQVLGLTCYSIYVWHGLLVVRLFPNVETDVSTTLKWYPIYLFLLFGISAMTYRFIEFGAIADWRRLFLLSPVKIPS